MAAALDLDYNSYAKCALEDVLKPADAWTKKESLFAMQSVVTIYSVFSVRESTKKMKEEARNRAALQSLKNVAVPG